MKKNLISVIILALCLLNLVLNALIVFVCVPSNKKVNNLITEIASVLNLELEASEGPQVAVEDIATFSSSESLTINLRDDGTGGDPHYAVVAYTISMDKSVKEFEGINTLITSSEGLINDDVRSVISAYTFAEINTPEVKEAVKKEIIKMLQKRFNSECIYSIDFKDFLIS